MKESKNQNALKDSCTLKSAEKDPSSKKEHIIKLFLHQDENIDNKNECGWTPLYRTIVADNSEATEIFLEMGANPNIPSNVLYVYLINYNLIIKNYFKICTLILLFIGFVIL